MTMLVNIEGISQHSPHAIECTADIEHCRVKAAVMWLAEKYGIKPEQVELGQLIRHYAVMAQLTTYGYGNGLEHPESTPGEEYDSARDDLKWIGLIHTVD